MVGRWLSFHPRHSGVSRSRYLWASVRCFTARRALVIGAGILHPRGVWGSVGRRPAPRIPTSTPDRPRGNSVGATGWPGGLSWLRPGALPGGARAAALPPTSNYPEHPLGGGLRLGVNAPSRVCDRPLKIVTWLILPVVICLSQRLSHACLSISNLYCETANGSLNQLSFI